LDKHRVNQEDSKYPLKKAFKNVCPEQNEEKQDKSRSPKIVMEVEEKVLRPPGRKEHSRDVASIFVFKNMKRELSLTNNQNEVTQLATPDIIEVCNKIM